ncbi:lipopolysaccharide export system permease protein lptF [Candidatus Photodesmus katoptron]|uniref:Lipopolysaccharide export system permease protein LptF n=1 Tax=Candidatus Photodesmus katoptron Akat1 TaxID=1236703 RepID=S3DFX6_9GAMM|nr:LPS export ABC transporter permease LptF [Candidatus Photodesmus katoptron]EPE37277.1 hypothetical protein O1U_0577 [Candidatus Photodesmus katoptron Akat1]KEY90066.1 lipopolysaccharide export system permease protein lptF [Candidatus Photodesmus katoptron]
MIIIRYLTYETFKSQLSIFFIFFLVFLCQKFIQVLAEVSDGVIPAKMILSIVTLNMPAVGLFMLPFSLYLGILLTFGRLYTSSEIIVMNSMGIGNHFLMRSALYLSIITGCIAAFNSFWLAPWSANREAELMEQYISGNSVDLLRKGSFHRISDGFSVVFIDDIQDKKLKNVFVAQIRPKNSILPSIIFSNFGDIKITDDGRYMITMYEGTRYEGIPNHLDYHITEFDEYEGIIGRRVIQTEGKEWKAIPTLDLISNSTAEAQAELQWRLSVVVSVPLLTILAIPLSSVNPRQGRFVKIGPAILIYLTYFLSVSAIKSAIEEGSIPIFVGMWPINFGLLVSAVVLNCMDTVLVRKLKDKIKIDRVI